MSTATTVHPFSVPPIEYYGDDLNLYLYHVNGFKKQRLNWLGHVDRIPEHNSVKKIKRLKPMSKRPIGKPKTRREDDVLG
jgi:hypothetical protein